MNVECCEILDLTPLYPGGWSMRLAAPAIAGQIGGPGQFVHVRCGSAQLRRPISICAWDAREGWVRLVFEERGSGTRWLARQGRGARLDVLGPLGHGFAVEPGGRYLLAGGGIGVPPLLGCALVPDVDSHAVLGFRTADRAMLLDDFSAACGHVPQVATDDGTLGHHGRVDELVRETLAKDKNFTAVLACGPKPMLRAIAAAAGEYGVPCQVSMEERMGCGVGACLVCACKTADGQYRHVCKDGPVFDAREVEWDE